MWCDIKNTKYGDRLKKQLGDKNAKEFSMAIETPKFQNWFGNGKTQKADAKTVVPFINPIMQIINEQGKTFNLLERFRFKSIEDVQNFFATNYTPGINRYGKDNVFFIAKNENRFLNVKLLEEVDRIYPGLIIKQNGELINSSVVEANQTPTWSFSLNPNYNFSQGKLFAKNELWDRAKVLGEQLPGVYGSAFKTSPEEALYEFSAQAQSSESERAGLVKTLGPNGEEMASLAVQIYPNAKQSVPYAQYIKENDIRIDPYSTPDEIKVRTILDKLSGRFGIANRLVNDPNGEPCYFDPSGNGEVVINLAKFRPDLPFHEFLHPFILVLQQQNPALYEALEDELNKTKEGYEARVYVNRNYPELTNQKDITHEAMVTYLGKLAQEKYDKPKSAFNRFVSWLKSIFKKINIDFKNLSLTTTLSDIADMIVDDIYVADLKAAARNGEVVKKYGKVDTKLTYENIFNRVKDRVAILHATVRNRKQGEQFKEDIEALNNIIENADEITSINNFVSNALTYVDSAFTRFESLRDSVKKANTLSQEDISYNLYILGEIQQLLNVYETLDDIKTLYVKEGMKSTDDTMAKLREAIDKKDAVIEDFKEFALTYLTEWLYPYIEPTNKALEAQGNKADVVSKDRFREQLEMALTDISAAGYWLGATINSQDPISAAIGLALKDVVYSNHVKDTKIKKELTTAYDNVRSTSIYSSKKNEEEFNMQFLKEVESWEQTGVDDQGQPTYGYVTRLAFHEEWNEDQFEKERRTLYKNLGPKPARTQFVAYRKYQKAVNEWYAQNTQVNPNAINIIAEKQRNLSKRQFEKWVLENTREVDEEQYDAGYKKSDFYRGKIYNYNQKNNTFRVYAGELIRPSAKYKNQEFTKLMRDPYYAKLYKEYKQANDKLGSFGLRYGIIPQVSKGKNMFSSLKWDKSAKENLKSMKESLGKSFRPEAESQYTVQRQDGTEVKKIPIKYTTYLERDDLEVNLLEGVLKFAQMANNYEGMTEIEPNILVLKTVLNGDFNLGIEGRKVAKTNGKGAQVINAITKKIVPKMATTDMLNSRLNEFINDVVYGDEEFQHSVNLPIIGEISWNKVADKVGLLTSLQNMAINFNGGINNVMLGNFNNSIEAFGGRFYGKKDWVWAHKEYFANMGEFLGEVSGVTKSSVNGVAEHYDMPQGEFQDQFGNNLTGGQVNKMLKTSSLFFIQKGGEHEIQVTGMLSLMHATKVMKNGQEINLYEAWKQADYNIEKVYQQTDWTEAKDIAFRNRMHAMTKGLQGIYNKFDKSVLQRRWAGKLAIMFRKYMFSSFKQRYGGKYIDYELGTVQQGYWNTFVRKLYKEAKDYKWHMFTRMWTKEGYSELEKAAINKTLYEFAVILSAMILAGFANDDDDKNWMEAETALQLTRMSADITQYISPSDFIRVVRNPAASVNMIEKWLGWFSQLAHPFDEYERSTGIAEKGDNKLYIKTLKIVPVIRQLINFMTPEEQIKFYQLTGKQ